MQANKDNTVFLTIGDYPDPQNEAECFLKTAYRFGYDTRWISYGFPFEGMVNSKILKTVGALSILQEYKDFAFVLDCRDIVFVHEVEFLLDNFNSVYEDGVLYGGNQYFDVWPLKKGVLIERIKENYGENCGVCAGCYGGKISEILKHLKMLLCIRKSLVENKCDDDPFLIDLINDKSYQEYNFAKHHQFANKKLYESEQFLVSTSQGYKNSLVRLDLHKKVIATFNFSYPDLSKREERNSQYHISDPRNIGDAGILHSPWLTYKREERPNLEDYKKWIDDFVESQALNPCFV